MKPYVYKAKIVYIEAMQFDGTAQSVQRMMDEWGQPFMKVVKHKGGFVEIETLEGIMTGRATDWIIRGTAGEFYPCKDEIFQRKYENVALEDGE